MSDSCRSPVPKSRPARIKIVVLVVLVAGLAIVGIVLRLVPVGVPNDPGHPASLGYVGSQACARCHESIHRDYQTHPMAHSVVPVTDDLHSQGTPGVLGRVIPGGVCEYEVSRDDGRVLHHERAWDRDGVEIYDQSVPVDWAIGSGTRGVSYMIDRGGLLFLSPLSWYAGANGWDLSPGYVADDPLRFDRRIVDECLACHVGRPNPVPQSHSRFRNPPFHEAAIGCENCHGPGQRHVEFRSKPPAAGESDPIVSPASLTFEQRESLCYQCHLQGVRILRPGRGPYDFRPGENLEDTLITLNDGRAQSDGSGTASVSQVQQMRESQCFQKSSSRLGCTSCHDPHSKPAPEKRVDFYRQKCLECHAEGDCGTPLAERRAEAAGDSCFECHMPRLSTRDVVHTSQSDHRIVRSRQASAAQAAPGTLAFFDNADQRLPDWERHRILGLAAFRKFQQTNQPARVAELREHLQPLRERSANDPPVLRALAVAAMSQGQFDEARTLWDAILKLSPDDEDALANRIQVGFRTGDYDAALKHADRFLAINPLSSEIQGARAQMLKVMGQPAAAMEAAREAARLNPRQIKFQQWLADTCRAVGELDQAALHETLVRRLQNARPRTPPPKAE